MLFNISTSVFYVKIINDFILKKFYLTGNEDIFHRPMHLSVSLTESVIQGSLINFSGSGK